MITYKKLWKLLRDREMKKSDLMRRAGISNSVMNKLAHGENVNAETLAKMCTALDCGFDDIMEMIPDNKE